MLKSFVFFRVPMYKKRRWPRLRLAGQLGKSVLPKMGAAAVGEVQCNTR